MFPGRMVYAVVGEPVRVEASGDLAPLPGPGCAPEAIHARRSHPPTR